MSPPTSPGLLKLAEPAQRYKSCPGAPDATEVTLSAGTLRSVSIAGATMTVEMSDVPDESCLAISLAGIADLDDEPLVGYRVVHIVVLAGDIDGNGVVTIGDAMAVNQHSGRPLADHARYDMDLNGVITIGDVAVPVRLAGRFVAAESGEDADCAFAGEGLLADCGVGEGRVLLLADAAILDTESDDAIRRAAVESLLARLRSR